ncbi:hypothetical protein T08_10595 [Trichinella sp. T8]|nr:hypothetical protein T08_10595 [Trichinella sp. T8]
MRNTMTEKSHYRTDCASCAVVVSKVLQSSRTLAFSANRGTFQQRTTQQIDCRGCTLGTLLKDHLWWNGSDWLQQPESEWPMLDVVLTPKEVRGTDPERRTTVVLNTTMPAQGLQMVIDPTRTPARWWPTDQRGVAVVSQTPLLLSSDGTIAALIVRRTHESELHAGVNQTLAALRRCYWVIRGRQAVKRCIKACIIWRRGLFCPLMSELPVSSGTYVSVLSGGIGLRRAVSCTDRRQHDDHKFSRRTPSLHSRERHPDSYPSRITFEHSNRQTRSSARFLSASMRRSFGTSWSAGAFSEDTPLKELPGAADTGRGLACFFEELGTNLCELEARINNRPLMLLSEDPRDCAPLTPAHFPIGRELAALPTSTQETSRLAGARQLRRRWQYQQMLMRQLWKRWTEEYLVSLTVRSKWKKINRQPEVDDLILVTEDTVPRNRWKLEVITELLLGSDDMVRSVRLRIAWEVLTRKSRSLVLLEPAKD